MSSPSAETLDALAFLYLTFGHATDGALTTEEMRSLADKLKQWAPDMPLDELGKVLRHAVDTYKSVPSRKEKMATATTCVQTLREGLDAKGHAKIVDDLTHIADADGNIDEQEQAFIAKVAETLGVPAPA